MKFVIVIVSALLGVALSKPTADADNVQIPQQPQEAGNFADQFAVNQAAAGSAGSVPGRFSYQVNSVHPAAKPQVGSYGPAQVAGEKPVLPAKASLPAVEAVPTGQSALKTPLQNRFAAYGINPWLVNPYHHGYLSAAGYLPRNAGYLPRNAGYLPYGYNYLPAQPFHPFGLGFGGPNAEE